MCFRRIGALAARSSRFLLVLLVSLLALAPRSARPTTAATTAVSRVAVGAQYVVVNAFSGHGACTPGPLPVCRPGAPGALGAPRAACTPGTPRGAVCGTVAVPLDRAHPDHGTISIFFELYKHSHAGPPQSAILVNFGGPGTAATQGFFRDRALFLFAHNLDVHDLLLVDNRGTGRSGTINCPPLQHGTQRFAQAEAACAAQLGPAASRYGSGDIAQDTEAVRAALGYDKVNYFAMSAGGWDVAAYATRYGAHLRSIVVDGPAGTPALDPFVYAHDETHADVRLVRLACTYSPTCRADHPDAEADLRWLVRSIQAHPLEGDAYNATGKRVHVRIDEAHLLFFIIHNPSLPFPFPTNFIWPGEVVAAAAALRRGDPAPLLRLGAEAFFPSPGGDSGDPTVFSEGASVATACANVHVPWHWSAAVSVRQAEYDQAVQALPPGYFAPFSPSASTGLLYNGGQQCLWWQEPSPSAPVTPPRPAYPRVPTLLLDGDMDALAPLEEGTKVAALFPESTLVRVVAAGHITTFWSQCAVNLVSRFVETRIVGNTSCTRTPETVWPAVGRFPLLAQDARPASIDPMGRNQIGQAERRVVTVAVAVATDALQRSYLSSSGGDHCLRTGTFHTAQSPHGWTTSLSTCAFAQDVTVSGTVTWGAGHFGGADNAFVATLAVSGPGTAGGTLHVVGTWLAPGPVGNFTVSGQLGGRNVGVLVPEA